MQSAPSPGPVASPATAPPSTPVGPVGPVPSADPRDFLHVSWDPRAADGRVAAARARFRASVVGLILALLVWGGYYLWSRRHGDSWEGTGQWGITAAVLGLSVALILVRLVDWRRKVRFRSEIGTGEVVTASWPGLQVAGHFWDWDAVGPVDSRPGRWGRGDRYVFATPGGPWEVGVDDLAVTPAALNDALWLYSRGRCSVSFDGIAH